MGVCVASSVGVSVTVWRKITGISIHDNTASVAGVDSAYAQRWALYRPRTLICKLSPRLHTQYAECRVPREGLIHRIA